MSTELITRHIYVRPSDIGDVTLAIYDPAETDRVIGRLAIHGLDNSEDDTDRIADAARRAGWDLGDAAGDSTGGGDSWVTCVLTLRCPRCCGTGMVRRGDEMADCPACSGSGDATAPSA